MTRVVELVRRIVRAELAAVQGSRLGVVTATFPHHGDEDDTNYEVDVRLKHEQLDLPRVPVAAAHMGMAAPPRVDDLVLVDFAAGDVNQPLVTGRFYHADERPPLHADGEVLIEHRVPHDDSRNQLRFAADGSIHLLREVTDPAADAADSRARTSVRIYPDGALGITAAQDVVIDVGDHDVIVTCDQMTVHGDLRVTSNGASTTISGNEITGGG